MPPFDLNALITAETFVMILQGKGITNGKFIEMFTALFLRHDELVANAKEAIANKTAAQAQSDAAEIVGQAAADAQAARDELNEYLASLV
jgi:hypothetical protein